MKYRSDLNLGEGLCIFTSFDFQDSGLYLLYVTVLTFNSICFCWSDTENLAICIFCLYVIIPSIVNQVPFSGLCLLLFLFPLSVEYLWSSEWASQIFLVALLAYVRRWCVFCLTTIVKQFVDSEGRFIPEDLKLDNKIIATGKIYALNSLILNSFFF